MCEKCFSCEQRRAAAKAYWEKYTKRYPGRYNRYWKPRLTKFHKQGKCPTCKEHRKVSAGRKNCWVCRKRAALIDQKIYVPVGTPREKIKQLLKLHGLRVK